ncbi:hypothetical protein N7471_000598 [Penicillium samsonianum]|uniref:uncharacterized protein n=1 Tax=Penicillium samsonianum TaxID=1882272 RepID=UPI002547156E|nr:uncharacterized protein N7471_000598 [Penicillium samsonianum]KAJ6149399.1 hypothetical protein N7471_000598 [Penicillium samsonianum]
MNTTPQQVLNIEDALVSEANPARRNGPLDYERCARLHNYLVAYGWMARHGQETPNLDELANKDSYLDDLERFVVIYGTVLELGSHCVGVVYDQHLHRAAFPMTVENMDSVEPIDEH